MNRFEICAGVLALSLVIVIGAFITNVTHIIGWSHLVLTIFLMSGGSSFIFLLGFFHKLLTEILSELKKLNSKN